MDRRRLLVATLLPLCAALARAQSTAQNGLDLAGLMALLARQHSGEASFVEQRFVHTLDAPLRSSGTLAFTAPDRLARRTLEPRAEAMLVEGDNLTLTRSGRTRSMQLDTMPEMLAIVEALRGTLTGNAQTLQRHFRTAVSGTADAWTLELTPLEAALASRLRSARLSGVRGEVHSVEMEMGSGDRSVTTITPMRAAPAGTVPAASGMTGASAPSK